MTMHDIQITELPQPPSPERLQKIRNPPQCIGDVLTWLNSRHYRGNKPFGGLWTSTSFPLAEEGCLCDWQLGQRKNRAIIHSIPPDYAKSVQPYTVHPKSAARILRIKTLADAIEFTDAYHLQRFEIPAAVSSLGGFGRLLTPEITNWEPCFRQYDGIHLSGDGADEIAWDITHGLTLRPPFIHGTVKVLSGPDGCSKR